MMLHRKIKLPKTQSFFLFGPRQTGKTTLIENHFTKNIWQVNLLFSEIFLAYSKNPAQFRQEAIYKIEKEKVKYIFIDEVQRIPELLNEVHYLIEKYKCQFILTGSSARKLKRKGVNLLAGRAAERHLFPLTYSELNTQISDGLISLENILQFGSLPSVIGKTKSEKKDILSSYVNTYLREEIQQEGLVRNIGGFSRFLDVAAAQFGELLNFSNLARECQLPIKTVQSYYEILEDTLIGYRLLPWRKSLRKRISAHPKFYFFDTGVVNALNKRLNGTIDRNLFGHLFEQWIIMETLAVIHYSQSETSLYFWRTNHGAEVDLLLERHGKIQAAIEIKSTKTVASAHLSGLRAFRQEYKDVQCKVVSLVENSFCLNDVEVLSWEKYFEVLEGLLV
jgi:uncharacterized protein